MMIAPGAISGMFTNSGDVIAVPFLLIFPALVKPAYSVLAIYGAQAAMDVIGVVFIVVLYRREQRKEIPA